MDSAGGCTTQVMSLRGSRPTLAAMLATNAWRPLPQKGHSHCASLEVAQRPHPVDGEEFVAPRVDARKGDQGTARIHARHDPRSVVGAEVHFTGSDGSVRVFDLDILDDREALGLEQLLGYELRGQAGGWEIDEPDGCGLRRRLGGDHVGLHAKEPCRPRQGQPAEERPPAEPVSRVGYAWEPPLDILKKLPTYHWYDL